jgi:hypothetical protein
MIVELFTTVTALVGAASILVRGIGMITAITPSTKDDEVVDTLSRGLAKAVRVLDMVAINPAAGEARQPKK